jgi:hypothetical protein
MSKPQGEGPYLLLVDYGLDGQGVYRFKTAKEMVDEVMAGNYQGPFIFAHEMEINLEEWRE